MNCEFCEKEEATIRFTMNPHNVIDGHDVKNPEVFLGYCCPGCEKILKKVLDKVNRAMVEEAKVIMDRINKKAGN